MVLICNELVKELTAQGLTIASAESLTGGLFSERLTTVSGAGEVVKGSLVAYHYEIKQNILGVSEHTLNQYGAVSEQCAAEMAQRIQQLYKTDIGIGFTGVAGPSKQEGHPVGTVHIGVAYKDQTPQVYSLQLSGRRQGIRSRTVNYGCHYVLKTIKK